MTYTFNQPTGEIIDDDGQVVATLSDNALPEQGEAQKLLSHSPCPTT